MNRGLNRADSWGTLAFVIAASCSSPSPEFDKIPEQFIISVTKFRKWFFFYVELSRLLNMSLRSYWSFFFVLCFFFVTFHVSCMLSA